MESAAGNDRVTALVASLLSGFARVHLSAVPSMMDCVLSSTGTSPSLLFDSLLGSFSNAFQEVGDEEWSTDSEKCNYILAWFCAISHLVKDIGAHGDCFQIYTWKAFVPLMKKAYVVDQEMLRQIITLFLDVIIEMDAWKDLGISLVPFLLKSIRVPTENYRTPRIDGEDENYVGYNCSDESTSSTTVENVNTSGLQPPGYFGLSLSCHILSETLDAALSNGEYQPPRLSCSGDRFACDLLPDLCFVAEQLLLQSLEYRSSAISILLPAIFKAFTSEILRSQTQGLPLSIFWRHFPEKIWNCCRKMFSLGYLERRDAYRVLSLYLSTETSQHSIKSQMGEFDIRDQIEFWDEMKRGLVDTDSLLRKQAFHMLKGVIGIANENQEYSATSGNQSEEKHLNTQTLTKRELWAEKEARSLGVGRESGFSDSSHINHQMWGAFLLLCQMLEEYGTHLVEAAWNHQVSSLLRFSISNNVLESCNGNTEIPNKIISSELPVWLAILWERGFHHDNPQVRCLILESFLSIDWNQFGRCVIALDEFFVLGPLIQGLNDPVHHEDFGVRGVYSSIILEGAGRFFYHYTGHLDIRRKITFLTSLASLTKQHSFGRAGLMTLSECIASVARRTFLDNASELGMLQNSQSYNDQVEHSLEPSLNHHPCTDLLDALRYVIESCKQHFNPNYRLQVCQKILEVAVSVVCPDSVPLEMLLHFVSAFPSEFTDYGGFLQIKLQQWLSGGRSKCSCSSCKGSGSELLKSLCSFPAEFVGSLHVGRSTFVCDDEELASWEGEVKRWVTTLFLVVNDKDDFDPLCMFIYDHGTRICEENEICQWLPIKYLILLLSLVCQLQQLLEKDADVCADPGRKLTFSCLLDTLNGTYQKFLLLFISIMKNLVQFTEVSCPVLWSTLELEETKLPSSVCGKLGGPSQRRLPSEITSSVLQAITSVKVITSLSSWCKMISTDVPVDFTFDFFWDFLWKTLSSSAYNSETEAEIGLAAYEALTPVLRTLVLRYTSLSLDQIAKQHNPVAEDMENVPLLDGLMKKFLQNINRLLEVGYLARSRKAALMKFKWCCLESLLLIPVLALKSGYKPARYKFYFSDDMVRETFAELVENLENAAEDAVLPMLRSIRLVLALLTSRSDILVSCGGVNIQMMWQLVQSSWILHVSCNKRKVAAISALLSSVLHPSYFGDEKMHMINGDSGPLKWFVEKVLEEGTRSPRTIRLAALHLTGLWLAYPRVLKYYIKELKLLSLHGSVAFDEDFEGELGDNHDAKAEVSLLAMSPEPELTKAFLNTELYARVSVAALFQKLADLAEDDDLVDIHDDKTAALEAGRLFLLELLNSAVNEKDLAKELYKKYSAVHRRKIRAWQMICGLSRFVHEDILDQVTDSLHTSLYRNNLPAVRQYLETFAINVYLKFPLLVKEQLVPILQDHNTKPQALSSYVFIAANIILHAPNQLKSKHLEDLLPPIIPLLTSHHHSLRGFTQLLVYKVLHKLFPPSSVEASQRISLEERCFGNLREYLSKNLDCMRLRASMEGYLDNYDPVISATPAGIFVNRVEDLEFECVPTSLMEQILNFLNVVREDLRCSMAKDLATIKSESLRLGEDQSNTNLNYDDKNDVPLLEPSMNASANFQRKFTLAKHGKEEPGLHASMGFSNLYQQTLGEMEKDDQLLDQSLQSRIMTVGKNRGSRQQIILVASLLDRIPNLAGLARTCEVFKASGLAIADTTVLQDKQFQLISVTAERWVPIIEVPVKNLVGFLQKKRRERFSILGLEQTANSVLLDKFAFPEKTVLVLGREKEGIPAEIIHILDACIEIPQLGIVRSLNVHVSGAVALWEYTRQQRCR